MVKNRTAQRIFRTIYCTLGLVGCVASLGIFDNVDLIRWDFYVHFTNISNFLCLGVMPAALIATAKRREDGFVRTAPLLKFIGMLGIGLDYESRTLTFRLTDRGVPFDPLQRPDPDVTLSVEDREIGGLGIFIAKKTMDSVTYAFEQGENSLTMTKNV